MTDMQEGEEVNDTTYKVLAQRFMECVETEDQSGIEQVLSELVAKRESVLLQDLGRLARDLHESLNSLRLDPHLADMLRDDIPDVKERLSYVTRMTEQAANTTIGMVESALPLVDDIGGTAEHLQQDWRKLVHRELSGAEFGRVVDEISSFFLTVQNYSGGIRGKLTEVLTAQSFQDLTGQVITRLISLVEDLEKNLVQLILYQARDHMSVTETAEGIATRVEHEHFLAGPRVEHENDSEEIVKNQDDVDAVLSSLGF